MDHHDKLVTSVTVHSYCIIDYSLCYVLLPYFMTACLSLLISLIYLSTLYSSSLWQPLDLFSVLMSLFCFVFFIHLPCFFSFRQVKSHICLGLNSLLIGLNPLSVEYLRFYQQQKHSQLLFFNVYPALYEVPCLHYFNLQ